MKIIHIVLLAVALVSGAAGAAPVDDAFLAARDAYNARDLNKLDALAGSLQDHPLQMYVSYWQISSRLAEADTGDVRAFLTRYAATPLAERLRGEWLKELGKQENWDLFNKELAPLTGADAEIGCYALQAKLARKEMVTAKDLHHLWFTDRTSPDGCEELFQQTIASGQISANDVWQRIRLALDAGNTVLAKQLSHYLSAGSGLKEKSLDAAGADPQRYIDRTKRQLGSRASRETMIFAIVRLARNQAPLAADYLKEIEARLPRKDVLYLWGQVAYRGALSHEPEALAWYGKVGDGPLSDAQIAWQARAALRAQKWPELLAAIDRLPESDQQESNWRYWKARALKAGGKTAEANELLLPLSRESHFYGLLAGEEVGPTLSNPSVLWKPSDLDVAAIRELPGIQRALYLNRLDMPLEALREWSMATRGFDDRRTLAAAEVASRAGWIDRAINTADRTRELHDYSLRFPTPFREAMTANARANQLDEAWVYGLIRQESRFLSEARSSAGAMGLMQLMPATARWVAGKLGIKNLRNTQITEVNTNLSLGTFYLRNVLDNLGDPVLATAGYNAGPNRARRWRGDGPLEGAIYAETIPISETRDYVKKVMANANLYALQLGLSPRPLKERMGTVLGRNQVIEVKNEDAGPGG